MSCNENSSNINQTFIIEALSASSVVSACTALYTNVILSCSGNTTIDMGGNIISFTGDIYTNNNITGNTINALNFISGTTNLLDVFNDVYVTGGTFSNITESISLTRNDGVNVIITGLTDFYTTGGTLIGNNVYFDRNDMLSAYTIDLSTLVTSGNTFLTAGTFNQTTRVLSLHINNNTVIDVFGFTDTFTTASTYHNGFVYFDRNDALSAYTLDISPLLSDVYVTGGTYSNGTATFTNNTGGTFNVTGFTTGDTYTTGFTYSNNVFTLSQNQSQPNLSILLNTMTGLTINGTASATTMSATTYFGNGSNLTGVGAASFSGGTVTGPTNFTAGLTANTISAATYTNLPVRASFQSTPSNPTTTTSTTGVMAGLSGSVTPLSTGKILVLISGDMGNNTASDGVVVQIRTGTGATPTNGTDLTGTTRGSAIKALNGGAQTVNMRAPFSTNAVVTGLTVGTTYWVDLSYATNVGGTATIADISISITEF